MAKFESPILVKRKLQVEFGEQTPGVDCIRDTFQRFVKLAQWGIDNVREDHASLMKKKSTKFAILFRMNHDQLFELLQQLALLHQQLRIEL